MSKRVSGLDVSPHSTSAQVFQSNFLPCCSKSDGQRARCGPAAQVSTIPTIYRDISHYYGGVAPKMIPSSIALFYFFLLYLSLSLSSSVRYQDLKMGQVVAFYNAASRHYRYYQRLLVLRLYQTWFRVTASLLWRSCSQDKYRVYFHLLFVL